MIILPGGAPHFWPGTGKVSTAIVLACPGSFEEKKGHPVANTSGANLNLLLCVLRRSLPSEFPSGDRFDYVISNSHPKVRFMARTKDTVPFDQEVEEPDNIDRLMREIGHCTTVLALSRQAGIALDSMVIRGFSGLVLRGSHPSFTHINTSIPVDLYGQKIAKGSKDATLRRIWVLARDILRTIEP